MKKMQFLKAFTFDTAGSAVVKFILAVTGVIVARTLGPEMLGKYLIILTFCNNIAVLVYFGTGDGVTRYVGELQGSYGTAYIRRLLRDVLLLRFFIFSGVAVAFVYWAQPIFSLLHFSFSWYVVGFVLLYTLVQGIFTLVQIYIQTQFEQRFVAFVDVVYVLVQLIVVGCMYVTQTLSVRTLLAITFVATVLRLFPLLWKARQLLYIKTVEAAEQAQVDLAAYTDIRKRFARYTSLMFIIGLAGALLSYRSDMYFLSFYLGIAAVGYYTLASNFVDSVYSIFLTRSFGTLYVSNLVAEYRAKGKVVLHFFFQKNVEYILFFSLPLAIGGYVVARDIILVVYGEAYLPAAVLLAQLFLVSGILRIGGAISAVFVAIEKPEYFMWTKVLSLINIPFNIVLIPKLGMVGAFYGTSFTLLLILCVEYCIARRVTQVTLPWRNISVILGVSTAMGVVVGGLSYLLASLLPAVRLAIVIPVGVFFYLTAIFQFNIVDREYVQFFIRKLRQFV